MILRIYLQYTANQLYEERKEIEPLNLHLYFLGIRFLYIFTVLEVLKTWFPECRHLTNQESHKFLGNFTFFFFTAYLLIQRGLKFTLLSGDKGRERKT